ncbi:bifunctional UDP-N-acetylglucosamine diphosphorylase/glucosamine-1-phosphate N-acetyltransferase GlmU [Ferviditalea candida]|uniref:Bifunctional protein GlmU n=1 Tax=Ferviditalea candida TaxID=3108399 RepID=A0ABU5ZL68_9BACL|nr:bifunctional UDP-N-acetylglucosamine diphosphorylase/glucosamine-1-phosphate N-acetyltransferase GlmU [Paenibacillaceae bacterium T2]
MQIMAVVLAAGQGKRMKSKLYKVLHPVCGKAMVGHVTDTLRSMNTEKIIVVVGHGAEAVRSYLGGSVEYALQAEQLGTAHAVLQAKELLENEDGTTIVICGDTPLIREETLRSMTEWHGSRKAAATVLTASMADPHGYGRIIRDATGNVTAIVEEKDCSEEERRIREINTGTYCFDNRKLFASLAKVDNHNAQNEYYLTDVIRILNEQGERVEGYGLADPNEAHGVNDRAALAVAEKLMRERINLDHMRNGVTMINPEQTYIDRSVRIGEDTVLYPGTWLRGNTVVGRDCVIGPNSEISDSWIGDGVQVKQSVLKEAEVGDRSSVGPFAYLRAGSNIGSEVKIGDFVEIKNASIASGSKVSHLAYVGDAKIGKDVNVGCGAITVNYDGYRKHLTEVEDGAFIGSNVNLIAPVRIGKGAYVVAGSTITHNVDENDLAIARERQINKPGYAEKMRNRIKVRNNEEKP